MLLTSEEDTIIKQTGVLLKLLFFSLLFTKKKPNEHTQKKSYFNKGRLVEKKIINLGQNKNIKFNGFMPPLYDKLSLLHYLHWHGMKLTKKQNCVISWGCTVSSLVLNISLFYRVSANTGRCATSAQVNEYTLKEIKSPDSCGVNMGSFLCHNQSSPICQMHHAQFTTDCCSCCKLGQQCVQGWESSWLPAALHLSPA